jgi:hypothetical protein
MAKFTCVNLPGHYEGNGIEVNVFPQSITVTTKEWQYNPKKRGEQPQQNRKEPQRKDNDDGNMSILSSIDRIANRFGKKK